MDNWLRPALDYIPSWIDFTRRRFELPGVALAVAERGRVVLEAAFGLADADRGIALTPRHRFRVASHSKSFTAAGIMKLREQGRLSLDDRAGRHVDGLHPAVAEATVAQLLSHGAGIIRDGLDSGQWDDRRPFRDERELRAELAEAPILEGSTRFKYSNHGYGLAGLIVEAVTGEPFGAWIMKTIVEPAGLTETEPDMPIARPAPFARGHSTVLPFGRRWVIPGENPTRALAPATGFVSTAADLARFFAQLDPAARRSILSPASRREMIRRQWRLPHLSVERHYGLGTVSGSVDDWDWFGHSGGFQGYITRTAVLPGRGLALSVLTNAVDGLADLWVEGAIHILRAFAANGAPSPRVRDWTGRWWNLWGAIDLLPMGDKVVVAMPWLANPLLDAGELAIAGRDRGRIALAGGFGSHGEAARRIRTASGRVAELWVGGTRFVPEARLVAEAAKRYGRRGKR